MPPVMTSRVELLKKVSTWLSQDKPAFPRRLGDGPPLAVFGRVGPW